MRASVIAAYNEEHATEIDPGLRLDEPDAEAIGAWLREIRVTRTADYYPAVGRLDELVFDGLESKFSRVLQAPCLVCGVRRDFPGSTFHIRISPASYQYASAAERTAFRRAIAEDMARSDRHRYGDGSICIRLVFALAPRRRTIDVDNMTKLTLDALKGQLFDDDRQGRSSRSGQAADKRHR